MERTLEVDGHFVIARARKTKLGLGHEAELFRTGHTNLLVALREADGLNRMHWASHDGWVYWVAKISADDVQLAKRKCLNNEPCGTDYAYDFDE